ncbi:hypothetical protein O7632_02890 [Solwaraspora sp. WMMD406]|uniref:hypothetical protein n=1 Tax=Solwaraspora sp. WMMD406 TaxID=3016095 RepID=UPI0024174CF1|nr:hypothetical protein [Solwaraspora sp. WMMD406]MDG4763061.1 hypothetical protein [Solwaraspora sp. WMMD406]
MTTDRFGEVDPDLLADYVGGALDGTPEQAVVARLIAERPDWSTAHDDMVRAARLVETMLAEWGSATAEPIPPEVSHRLNVALNTGAAGDAGAAGAADADDAIDTDGAVNAPDGPPTPTRLRPIVRQRPPVRHRWRRFAAPIAVAAAAVAFAGFGLQQFVGGGFTTDSSTTAGGAPDEGTPDMSAGDEADTPEESATTMTGPAGPVVVASGTDYQSTTLGRALADIRDGSGPGIQSQPGEDITLQQAPAVPALGRFADPVALSGCVAAVTDEHDAGALGVDLVDLATFEGAPALIIAFTDSAGASWIWVSGPGCGQPATGADTRYTTRVG